VVALEADSHRVVVGPREALRTRHMRLRSVNWLGEGDLDAALDGAGTEIFVKVRSTRPPQPAWLRREGGAIGVELAGGEDGVSPGQACVFYDAQAGEARVLGGGFIDSTDLRAGAGVQAERHPVAVP
jgi:tRNA-specific 2-thiouridylase